jgi:hypothetical protein
LSRGLFGSPTFYSLHTIVAANVAHKAKQAEDEVKKEHPELVPGNGDSPSR